MIKDSGDRTVFSTGAVRDMSTGKGRMDLVPWLAVIEISKHCEEGAAKYGPHNVDKGIPLHSLCDSGMRHLAKFVSGMTDENHLVAAAWNILWAIQMTLTHPELIDVPWDDAANSEPDAPQNKQSKIRRKDPDGKLPSEAPQNEPSTLPLSYHPDGTKPARSDLCSTCYYKERSWDPCAWCRCGSGGPDARNYYSPVPINPSNAPSEEDKPT